MKLSTVIAMLMLKSHAENQSHKSVKSSVSEIIEESLAAEIRPLMMKVKYIRKK